MLQLIINIHKSVARALSSRARTVRVCYKDVVICLFDCVAYVVIVHSFVTSV